MQRESPLISVIVVNWNGERFLPDCMESLTRQSWSRKEIIVVDNGSRDGSLGILSQWERKDNIRVIKLPVNTGFTKANNIAFTQANGEWLALLNNDAVADPRWLERLVSRGDPEKRIGMLGGKILFSHSPTTLDKAGHLIYWDGLNRGRGTGREDVGQYDREEEILWPDGCASLYHRQLIEETGGFDEDFFAYGDDADLGMRARLLGWKGWYVPDAVVYHRHSATAGAYSPMKVMLVERNRMFLAMKNFPISILLQNPYWTLRRYGLQAYGALKGMGDSGRFVQEHGRFSLVCVLVRAYVNAFRTLIPIARKRRSIQKSKRLSNKEVIALLRRFQIDLRELTLSS